MSHYYPINGCLCLNIFLEKQQIPQKPNTNSVCNVRKAKAGDRDRDRVITYRLLIFCSVAALNFCTFV